MSIFDFILLKQQYSQNSVSSLRSFQTNMEAVLFCFNNIILNSISMLLRQTKKINKFGNEQNPNPVIINKYISVSIGNY